MTFLRGLVFAVLLGGFVWSVNEAPADVLYLRDGKVVPGELIKDGTTKLSFKSLSGKTKRYDKSKIARLELTWMVPDLARTDPQWSGVMVQDRIKRDLAHVADKVDVLRTKHYIIFTNSPAGKKYLETMEDVHKQFKKEFPFVENEADLLMPVFLFLTNSQYYEFCQKSLRMSLEQAQATAGVASRDFYACYYSSPKDSIHYHEGAHQLVESRLRIPGGGSWFQEGLAVYFEMAVFPQQRQLEIVRSMVKSNRHTPLRELMELRSLIFSSDHSRSSSVGGERYDQSGSVIHFMKLGPRKDKFDLLLDTVRPLGFRRGNWSQIIQQVYGISIEEFEKEWIQYMTQL